MFTRPHLLFTNEGPIKREDQPQERRMLTIEIVDTKTQQVVWSRWRSRVTDQPLGSVQIRQIIAQMLKPFHGIENPPVKIDSYAASVLKGSLQTIQ